MRTNLMENATTQFRVLSDNQIEQIFLGALELLEDVGTIVHHEKARELLAENSAVVDGENVRISAGLVQETLALVPRRIAVGNRDGKRTVILESGRIYYGTGSDCPFIIDRKTGERRKFVKQDTADAARVVDACDNMDFHMSLGLTSDVPTYSYDRHQAAAMLRNTIKPLTLTTMSKEGLSDIVEMYYLIRGGRDAFEVNPGFIVYLEPVSPLLHGKAVIEKLMFAAERRIPAIYTPAPMLGATAPVTLAGALAQALAEFFVGVVISQLTRKGAPMLLGGVISPVDMRTMVFTYGSPEFHLLSAASAEISRWLQIPVFSTAGCSDSKVLDEQAAAEAAMSILTTGLSGGNLIHDVGFLESGLLGSYEMIVLSDELVEMAKRFLSGIKVDEETLALDVIKNVGPGGNFLTEEHTARHMRTEIWMPKFMDRTRYDNWKKSGSKTMGDRIRERVDHILETHEVPLLPDEVNDGIDNIIAAADQKAAAEQAELV